MTNKDITKAYYDNDEVLALYLGGDLIYRRENQSPFGSIMGVWEDDPIHKEYNGRPYIMVNDKTRVDDIPIYPDKSFVYNFPEKLTKMSYMFSNKIWENSYSATVTDNNNLVSVDLSNLDTSNVTSMDNAFSRCRKLVTVDLSNLDTSRVTSMVDMFEDCDALVSVKMPHTLSTIRTGGGGSGGMFCGCSKLQRIENINIRTLSGYQFDDFRDCSALTTVIGTYKAENSLNLGSCPLTNESAMVFINGLAEVSTTKTITFKKDTFNSLTNDQIALATAKGWSVVGK